MDLSTARVLVTGGSTGIGRATAALLVRRGARVAVCGRNAERLRAAADEIGALAIPADVADEDDVRNLVRIVVEELGGIDVLVNNAGIGTFAPLLETTAVRKKRPYALIGRCSIGSPFAMPGVSSERVDLFLAPYSAADRTGDKLENAWDKTKQGASNLGDKIEDAAD
mgnify:CR=1 FL=1